MYTWYDLCYSQIMSNNMSNTCVVGGKWESLDRVTGAYRTQWLVKDLDCCDPLSLSITENLHTTSHLVWRLKVSAEGNIIQHKNYKKIFTSSKAPLMTNRLSRIATLTFCVHCLPTGWSTHCTKPTSSHRGCTTWVRALLRQCSDLAVLGVGHDSVLILREIKLSAVVAGRVVRGWTDETSEIVITLPASMWKSLWIHPINLQ